MVSNSQTLRLADFSLLCAVAAAAVKKAAAARTFSLSAPTVRCSHTANFHLFLRNNLLPQTWTETWKSCAASIKNVWIPGEFFDAHCDVQRETHTTLSRCKRPCAGVCTTLLPSIQSRWSSSSLEDGFTNNRILNAIHKRECIITRQTIPSLYGLCLQDSSLNLQRGGALGKHL